MKKTFREHHLLKALNSFDFNGAPLDVHIGQYFRENRALGSKDRKTIAEKIYKLVRWLALVDHFCEDSHSWEDRCETLDRLNINKLIEDPSIPTHIRSSFPKSFFQLLENHYGEEKAQKICLASNTPAPTTVRVNVLKTTRQTLLAKWKDKFPVSQTDHSVWGINFDTRLNFQTLDDFKDGCFEVQDEASQLVADLVDAEPGDHVLDYCAGSGGKTLAFAHKLQRRGQIYLHDIRERPLIEAKKRLKRAGIENAQILAHDATHKASLKGKMNWLLLDVPCSGSGTLRRNPDIKWKFSMEMLERLIQEQRAIFEEALPFLAPNGKIVYSTCSLLPQENEEQLFYFQDKYNLDLCGKPFQSLPSKGGMDGFFGAVFQRKS